MQGKETENLFVNGIMSENHEPHELYKVVRVTKMTSLLRRMMMITRRNTQISVTCVQNEFH